MATHTGSGYMQVVLEFFNLIMSHNFINHMKKQAKDATDANRTWLTIKPLAVESCLNFVIA